jgi:hypothetical protein
VSVVYTPNKPADAKESTVSSSYLSPAESPNHVKRSPSLFSCISSSCMPMAESFYLKNYFVFRFVLASKNKMKTPTLIRDRRNSKTNVRRRSADGQSTIATDKHKPLITVTYRTEVRPKTINPEWNEHFEL